MGTGCRALISNLPGLRATRRRVFLPRQARGPQSEHHRALPKSAGCLGHRSGQIELPCAAQRVLRRVFKWAPNWRTKTAAGAASHLEAGAHRDSSSNRADTDREDGPGRVVLQKPCHAMAQALIRGTPVGSATARARPSGLQANPPARGPVRGGWASPPRQWSAPAGHPNRCT